MMILVGIGGALGAASRFLIGNWIVKKTGKTFPFATFYINTAGSLLLGILTGMRLQDMIPSWSWCLLGIGFCGAFTTFSTFGYETVHLFLEKKYKIAILYLASSTVFCTVLALFGIQIIV